MKKLSDITFNDPIQLGTLDETTRIVYSSLCLSKNQNSHKKSKFSLLTVTVANKPSGTFATIIPIKKITACTNGYLNPKEMEKNKTPRNTATAVMMCTK